MARVNKKQHKIPSTYLSGFTNNKGLLWVINHNLSLFSQKPKNLLTENDYFTVRFNNGGGTLDIETKFLGGIEGNYAQIYEQKIKNKEIINLEDKAHLSIFVASMMERQPMSRSSLKKFISQLVEHSEHLKGLPDSTKKRISELPSFQSSGPSMSIEDVLESAKDVNSLHTSLIPRTVVGIAPIIFEMKWAFLVRPQDSELFITSDNPCKMINPVLEKEYGRGTFYSSPGLAQKYVELSLPLSSNISLFCGWELNCDCFYIPVKKEEVNNLNHRTWRGANYLIGSDKDMLQNIVDKTKIKQKL